MHKEDSVVNLLNSLKETESYLSKNKNRNINLIQIKIVLNRLYNQIVKYINEFNADFTHSVDEKIDVAIKVMNSLDYISNQIPYSPELKILQMNFRSLSNFNRINLAYYHYDSDKMKGYSVANMLSELLLGNIEKIDKLPNFPPYKDDPFKFLDIFIPFTNYLQTTFGVYQVLIENSTLIHHEDLIEWANGCIWNYKLMYDMITKHFNIRQLLETKKIKKINTFYDNVLSIGITLVDMNYIFLTLSTLLDDWTGINYHNMIKDESIPSILKLNRKIINILNGFLDDIKYAYDTHIINKNDRIEANSYYNDYLMVIKDIKLIEEISTFYNLKNVYDSKNIDIVEKIITELRDIMDTIVMQVGDLKNLKESFYINSFLDGLYDIIPFIAIKALYVGDITYLENFFFEFREIIDHYYDIDSNLSFSIEISRIFVQSRLNYKIDFANVFSRIYNDLNKYVLKPRIYLSSITFLILISPLIPDNINVDLTSLFNLALENGLIEKESKLASEFKLYLEYIVNPERYDISQLEYRLKPRVFDPMTVIIPNFEIYYKSINRTPLKYIPFNRECDKII